MGNDGDTEGLVSCAELTGFADLFDRFEHALEPDGREAKEAQAEFEARLLKLFEERVQAKHARLPYAVFVAHTRSLCRRFLRANPPKPPKL